METVARPTFSKNKSKTKRRHSSKNIAQDDQRNKVDLWGEIPYLFSLPMDLNSASTVSSGPSRELIR